MDERLKKALEHSHYKNTLNTQKEALAFQYRNALIVAKNGGLFVASHDLMVFIQMLVQRNHATAIITDSRDTPIKIDDLAAFGEELLSTYFKANNSFHADMEKLRRARTVSAAVD